MSAEAFYIPRYILLRQNTRDERGWNDNKRRLDHHDRVRHSLFGDGWSGVKTRSIRQCLMSNSDYQHGFNFENFYIKTKFTKNRHYQIMVITKS
jgi:hypothetical protein